MPGTQHRTACAGTLSRAAKDVFDKPLIQRSQQHKIKNGRDKLPAAGGIAETLTAIPRLPGRQAREPSDANPAR